MDKETGGAAFPRAAAQLNVGYVGEQKGMSLRDYFAGQALAGCLADPDTGFMTEEKIAEACYKMADAMLEARKT